MVGLFYFAPNQNLQSKQNFIEKLNGSIDRIQLKYPYAGIFLLGDKNDLSLDSTCRNFNLKQMVDFPTTKGGTQLDVIYTNIKQYYKKPTLLPALGRSYHYSIKIIPDFEAKHNYKVTEICSRPVTDKGLLEFGNWITRETWSEIINAEDVNDKVLRLHGLLTKHYIGSFPVKRAKSVSLTSRNSDISLKKNS